MDCEGWMLDRARINELQAESMAETIRLAKAAHFTNVRIRINGEWRELEADWIKHLRLVPRQVTVRNGHD